MAAKEERATGKANGEQAAPGADEGAALPEEPAPSPHVCDVAFCPIGLALSAVQPIQPAVVEHLLVAGRELLLAAKAVLDARTDDLASDGVAPTLEKIDIG